MSSNIEVKLDVLNQKASPALYAAPLADRPAASFTGRLFVDSDSPSTGLYRDTGSLWIQIADAGAGTSGTLQQVTTNGNTTSIGISVTSNGIGIGTTIPATNRLDIHSASGIQATFNGTGTTNSALQLQSAGVGKWNVTNKYNSAANDFAITDVLNTIDRLTIKNTGQTFIGANTTSSGLFVVNSATSDNHIVILGANAPSLRFRNAGTGGTLNTGLGISTATNNFIQGSASGDYCIFNSSTTASPILFGVYDAGTGNTQEAIRISAARNFLIGTTTDSGYNLDVNGTGRFNSSVTATSFVKSGGTSSQILAANGSVITAGTNITISGGTISYSGGSSTPTAISFTQTTPSGSFSMSYATIPGMYFFYNSDISANGGSFTQQNFTIKSNTTIFSSNDITSIFNSNFGAGFGSGITSLSLPNLVYVNAYNSFGVIASLLNSLTLTSLKVIDAYFFIGSTQLTTISLPALEFSRCLSFQSNSLVTTISLPNLKYVMDIVVPQSNTIQIIGTNNALTSITFPSIIRIKSTSSFAPINWSTGNCTNLNTFSFGSGLLEYSGNDAGTTGSFSIIGAALNQASVDNILIRFAALDGTSGTVAFSNRSVGITGGTSSTPSASGLAAKSTLVARGCTVTNN